MSSETSHIYISDAAENKQLMQKWNRRAVEF